MSPIHVSEAEWQSAVVDLAHLGGWRIFHALPASRGGRIATHTIGHNGFPDLVLVHALRGVLFVELKTTRGRISEDQDAWITELAAAGADVRVWRPSDLNEVRRTLVGRIRPVRRST
jgi:hypothetical protein